MLSALLLTLITRVSSLANCLNPSPLPSLPFEPPTTAELSHLVPLRHRSELAFPGFEYRHPLLLADQSGNPRTLLLTPEDKRRFLVMQMPAPPLRFHSLTFGPNQPELLELLRGGTSKSR